MLQIISFIFCLSAVQIANFQGDIQYYKNLNARQDDGSTTYFSLSKNEIVNASEDWDISFNRTSIVFKGEYAILDEAFEQINELSDNQSFTNDQREIKEWYEYDHSTHIIFTIPHKTFILKSKDEAQYTKLQIMSYYKNAPKEPQSDEDAPGFYTFRFQHTQKNSKVFTK